MTPTRRALVSTGAPASGAALAAPSVILAHLSDVHLPPPERCGGRALKQRIARAAWGRKRRAHRPEGLAAVLADMAARAPAHVCLTGDLVNLSTPAELLAARAWLEALAAPRDLTVSPGNHDLLVARGPDPWRGWRPWMEDAPGPFPHLRVRGRVALINLCSAAPTPVFSARGRLGGDQLAALEPLLAQTGAEGLHRVVLLHHPPTPGAPRRKALADQAALAAVLARCGAELVLHGHLHRASLAALPGPRGPIPVLGAPSASAGTGEGRGARWTAVELVDEGEGLRLRVEARGPGRDGAVRRLGGWELAPLQ